MTPIKALITDSIQHKDGFTLLEVMIAVSILAIVLTSVFRLQSQTLSMHMAGRFQTTAPLLVKQKMAEFEATPLSELTDDSGDFKEGFNNYKWTVTVEDVEVEFLEDTAIGDLKKIDLTVSYNEGEFSYDVRTYRFVQEE